MKKVLVFSLLLAVAGRSFSQKLEDINGLMDKKLYPAAKSAIDKYTADSKTATDGQGWYYKGFVYNSYSKDPSVSSADAFSYKSTAYDAFRKSQQYDKNELNLKTEFYASYFDLYLGFYGLGGVQFNNKDFTGAYKSFSKAQEVENYILQKKYTNEQVALYALDTSLVMNMGASALQSGDTTSAVKAYRRIADQGVTGADYQAIYEYLASYYFDKNDENNLQPFLAKAKAAYPQDKYWDALEIEKLSNNGDKTALFARYDELFKADPNNFTNTYNYGVVLYNEMYGKDAKTPVDPAMREKLTAVLKAAIPNDPNIESSLLLSSHLFNWASDYSTQAALIKGAKPDDVKAKKELTTKAVAKMDEAIPYGQKTVDFYKAKATLTTKEKLNYKSVLNNMSDLYAAKADPKKAAEYDKLADAIKF